MDTTFSVRISDELKEKFNNLAQNEGINNKEFMETMIKFYELNSVKEDNLNISEDINELQGLTNRMVDIFINSIERNKQKIIETTNVNKDVIRKKEDEIQSLKMDMLKLKEENEKLKNLKKELDKKDERIKSLEDNLKKIKSFNDMLEEKNDILEEQLKEISMIKEEEEKRKEYINKLEKEIVTLNSSLKETSMILDNKEEKLKVMQSQYENQLQELKIKNNDFIEMEKEKIALEFERKILKLEEDYKEKLNLRESELNSKIINLMEKREEDGEVIRKLIMGNLNQVKEEK